MLRVFVLVLWGNGFVMSWLNCTVRRSILSTGTKTLLCMLGMRSCLRTLCSFRSSILFSSPCGSLFWISSFRSRLGGKGRTPVWLFGLLVGVLIFIVMLNLMDWMVGCMICLIVRSRFVDGCLIVDGS